MRSGELLLTNGDGILIRIDLELLEPRSLLSGVYSIEQFFDKQGFMMRIDGSNDAGQVIGHYYRYCSSPAETTGGSFLWSAEAGYRELPFAPLSMNENGQILGGRNAHGTADMDLVLYSDGFIRDLGRSPDPNVGIFYLENDGNIIAMGIPAELQGTGQAHVYLYAGSGFTDVGITADDDPRFKGEFNDAMSIDYLVRNNEVVEHVIDTEPLKPTSRAADDLLTSRTSTTAASSMIFWMRLSTTQPRLQTALKSSSTTRARLQLTSFPTRL